MYDFNMKELFLLKQQFSNIIRVLFKLYIFNNYNEMLNLIRIKIIL